MYFDDIKVNDSIIIDPVTINKSDMIDFAKKYDPIPLHTDEEYAKKTRFKALIAPGVMSFMSVWAQYAQYDFAGEQLIAGISTKIEWFAPVYDGDVLYGTATVTGVTARNKYNGIVEITIDVYNQKKEHVLIDVTETVVARKV